MLDISNEIAYGGLMVDGVPHDREPFPSGKLDRGGGRAARLAACPAPRARDTRGGDSGDQPFRQVAERAAGIHREVFTQREKDRIAGWPSSMSAGLREGSAGTA